MSKAILEGMATAFCENLEIKDHCDPQRANREAMQTAVKWLSENVTDDLMKAAWFEKDIKSVIRAALLEAARDE